MEEKKEEPQDEEEQEDTERQTDALKIVRGSGKKQKKDKKHKTDNKEKKNKKNMRHSEYPQKQTLDTKIETSEKKQSPMDSTTAPQHDKSKSITPFQVETHETDTFKLMPIAQSTYEQVQIKEFKINPKKQQMNQQKIMKNPKKLFFQKLREQNGNRRSTFTIQQSPSNKGFSMTKYLTKQFVLKALNNAKDKLSSDLLKVIYKNNLDQDAKKLVEKIKSGQVQEAQILALSQQFIQQNQYVHINEKIVKTAIGYKHFDLAKILVDNGYQMPYCYIAQLLRHNKFDIIEYLIDFRLYDETQGVLLDL